MIVSLKKYTNNMHKVNFENSDESLRHHHHCIRRRLLSRGGRGYRENTRFNNREIGFNY